MSRKVLKIGCKVTMVSSARSTVVVLVVGLVTAPVVAPQNQMGKLVCPTPLWVVAWQIIT